MHVTVELIRALQSDEIPQTLGELLLSNHLAAVWTPYQRSLLATRQRAGDAFFERLLELWCGERPASAEIDHARQDLDVLLELPFHSDRLQTVERARTRYSSPVLVALALNEARSSVAANPRAAFEFAELAMTIARRGKAPRTAVALALAHAGNAYRAAGELASAWPYLDQATAILHQQRQPPPWLVAELASLEGSLLKDARRLDAAHRCLLHARGHFEQVGDTSGVARVQVKIADVHHLAGRPRQAIEAVEEALDEVRGITDPKLLVSALHNLVVYLTHAEHLEKAKRVLEYLAPVYAWYPEFAERHLWLEGIVARELRDFDSAEASLREALSRFLARGLPTYSALVALDVAETLIATGRISEVATVTHPLPPLFRAQGVEREATAAVVLFHKAASQQRVTRRLLTELRTFLERFQRDRSLRFRHSRRSQ